MGSSTSIPTEEQVEQLQADVDLACAKAADAISKADILVLCTGAGFSADSGLAVYADVAQVRAYKDRGLQYHDICQPSYLRDEPDLFWGFWGQCYNDYRETAPHAGYEIIDRWVEERFRHSDLARSLRERMPEMADRPTIEPYQVTERPGAFYVFTSNVDAHHFDWFRAAEIRECHGNTEIYQCSKTCAGVWRAPAGFKFRVDQGTMLAGSGVALSPEAGVQAVVTEKKDIAEKPCIGQVSGGGRPHTLRYMPAPSCDASAGFATNQPTCIHCGGPGRPAILMFGDSRWQDVDSQEARWVAWQRAVEEFVADTKDKVVRIVILELGAGGNVPTVRRTSEACLKNFLESGADAHLVRVNPDLPLGDDSDHFAPGGDESHRIISVMARGLGSLQKIDACVARLQEGCTVEEAAEAATQVQSF